MVLEEPEYKDFDALDFVFNELNLLLRSEGEARAVIERNVLVERAVAAGIQRHNIEVAITWLVMAKVLLEKDGIVRFAHRNGIGGNCQAPPGLVIRTSSPGPIRPGPIPS